MPMDSPRVEFMSDNCQRSVKEEYQHYENIWNCLHWWEESEAC